MSRTRVAVYGASLYMTSLVASLTLSPSLEVVRMAPGSAILAAGTPPPAVVVFEQTVMTGDVAVRLLRERPDLIVMAVDPSSDKVLVLSGHQEQLLSATDLVQVILAVRKPA